MLDRQSRTSRCSVARGSRLLLLTFFVLAGCGQSQPEPSAPTAAELERLRAIGYVSWDDRADPSVSGVTRFDRQRAAPGHRLYSDDADTIRLIDLDGNTVHEWRVPDSVLGDGPRHCEEGRLLADGRLLVVCTGKALVLLDRDSNVLLEAQGPMHHDAAMLDERTVLAINAQPARRYRRRHVIFDALTKITPVAVDRVWSTFDERRALAEHHAESPLETPLPRSEPETEEHYDFFHLNSLQILPDSELGQRDSRFRAGNWLVCLRNVDLVAVLDQGDQRITWSIGPGLLDFPHMPRMLENGNILLFDNGTHRGTSRVIEIDPPSGEIVWQYPAEPNEGFFSRWRGGAERLANGNTLITESERGHVIEVTRDGEIVWEFWNPELRDGDRKRIYRMHHVDDEAVEALQLESSP